MYENSLKTLRNSRRKLAWSRYVVLKDGHDSIFYKSELTDGVSGLDKKATAVRNYLGMERVIHYKKSEYIAPVRSNPNV